MYERPITIHAVTVNPSVIPADGTATIVVEVRNERGVADEDRGVRERGVRRADRRVECLPVARSQEPPPAIAAFPNTGGLPHLGRDQRQDAFCEFPGKTSGGRRAGAPKFCPSATDPCSDSTA